MFNWVKTIVSTDNATSSRRFILFYYALCLETIVAVSTVILSFYIIFNQHLDKDICLPIMKYMLWLNGLFMVFTLLMAGVITWQNINDTIASVKGLPQSVQQLTQTVEKTTTELTNKQKVP